MERSISISRSGVLGAVCLGGLLLAGVPARADVTVNIGAVSNYLWRGVSQTDDGAAIQGGIDYEHESGFYAGTWASNVDFGDGTSAEVDLYAGFANELAGGFGYDVSLIYYAFPDSSPDDIDFLEANLALSYRVFTAGVAYTIASDNDDDLFDTGDVYLYAAADFPLPNGFSIGLLAGYYNFDNDGSPEVGSANYDHYALSVGKETDAFGFFSFNLEYADIDPTDALGTASSDDLKVWVGWTIEF